MDHETEDICSWSDSVTKDVIQLMRPQKPGQRDVQCQENRMNDFCSHPQLYPFSNPQFGCQIPTDHLGLNRTWNGYESDPYNQNLSYEETLINLRWHEEDQKTAPVQNSFPRCESSKDMRIFNLQPNSANVQTNQYAKYKKMLEMNYIRTCQNDQECTLAEPPCIRGQQVVNLEAYRRLPDHPNEACTKPNHPATPKGNSQLLALLNAKVPMNRTFPPWRVDPVYSRFPMLPLPQIRPTHTFAQDPHHMQVPQPFYRSPLSLPNEQAIKVMNTTSPLDHIQCREFENDLRFLSTAQHKMSTPEDVVLSPAPGGPCEGKQSEINNSQNDAMSPMFRSDKFRHSFPAPPKRLFFGSEDEEAVYYLLTKYSTNTDI